MKSLKKVDISSMPVRNFADLVLQNREKRQQNVNHLIDSNGFTDKVIETYDLDYRYIFNTLLVPPYQANLVGLIASYAVNVWEESFLSGRVNTPELLRAEFYQQKSIDYCNRPDENVKQQLIDYGDFCRRNIKVPFSNRYKLSETKVPDRIVSDEKALQRLQRKLNLVDKGGVLFYPHWRDASWDRYTLPHIKSDWLPAQIESALRRKNFAYEVKASEEFDWNALIIDCPMTTNIAVSKAVLQNALEVAGIRKSVSKGLCGFKEIFAAAVKCRSFEQIDTFCNAIVAELPITARDIFNAISNECVRRCQSKEPDMLVWAFVEEILDPYWAMILGNKAYDKKHAASEPADHAAETGADAETEATAEPDDDKEDDEADDAEADEAADAADGFATLMSAYNAFINM